MMRMYSVRYLILWISLLYLCEVNKGYYYEEEQQPTYLTAAVGDHIIFNCDLGFPQGIPIPYTINWNKEGKTVFSWNNGVFTVMEPYLGRIHLKIHDAQSWKYGRASVNLTSIRETDNGWFECKVLFPNRTPNSRNNGTWYYLTVNETITDPRCQQSLSEGGNLLAIPPINQTTLEGEEAQFTCSAKDKNTFIKWYKDGIPLKNLSDILQRSWISDDGTLAIRPTAMGDSGEYECEATNQSEEKQSARAYLNVQYRAKVIYAPREINLPYGRSAILDCHFRANPPLTNLKWEKDGFLFDPYNVPGVFYRRNGSLYFSKVDETHSGYYSCTPYNDLGTEGASPQIHVIVQRPPVFVVTPQNLYLRKLGESVEISCDARDGGDEHRPTVIWYKKDGFLPIGRFSIRDGNLTIINIQEDDRGLYQCSASNEAATITAETELIVENVAPRPPYNLTATVHGTTVHLKWIAGRRRSQIEYNVWYRPVDSPEWRTMQVSSKKTLEATISNLSPGREYEFMVLSKEAQGEGLFSKSITAWTKGFDGQAIQFKSTDGSPPIGYPNNVSVHTTEDGYLVTWDPPEYGFEDLRVYVVRWYQGPQEYLYGSAETKNTSYLIPDLEEGKDYKFQVIAMSINDYQSASDKVTLAVPAYRKIRAVSVGLITGLAFLGAIFAAVCYIKKKFCKPYAAPENGWI